MSLLLFIATAILATLGYLQWRTMNVSVKQTQDIIKFAKQQADAAEKAVSAANNSAHAAMQSTEIAKQATSIARKEFLSSRAIFLKAELDNKKSSLMFKPANPEVTLQEAEVFYIRTEKMPCLGIPEEGDNCVDQVKEILGSWDVIPPRFDINFSELTETCTERMKPFAVRLDNVTGKMRVSSEEIVTYVPIPIIISATYVAKGEIYKDLSLYYVQVWYQSGPLEWKYKYLNLFFIRHLEPKTNIPWALDYEWKKIVKPRGKHDYTFPKVISVKTDAYSNLSPRMNASDKDLKEAISKRQPDVVGKLIRTAEINARDSYGETFLIYAVFSGDVDIVSLILSKGADVNARDSVGMTALMHSASCGYIDLVRLLLTKGADINVRTKYGDTALDLAMEKGHKEIVTLLKSAGAEE